METKFGLNAEEKERRMKAICQTAKERTLKIDLIMQARNNLLKECRSETDVNIINIGTDFLISQL